MNIKDWLNTHKIEHYSIIPDADYGYVVNVKGSVDLSHKNIFSLPIQFNCIEGDFLINDNNLTSLRGGPITVKGNLDLANNLLTSLEGCPESIGGGFACFNNQLTSLKGGPKTVKKLIYAATIN